MLLMILPLIPLFLLGLAYCFFRTEPLSLVSWRKGSFIAALVLNSVSIAVLLTFLVHAYLVSRGTKPVDLDRMYPVLSMMGLALLAALLALFGRRVSRLMLVDGGLATMVIWYLAAMGASP